MPNWTYGQLRDFEARRYSSQHIQKVLAEPFQDESALHNEIICYCMEKGWQYLHGSMATRTHRTRGEPDFIILAHGSQLRMVEVKSKTGKLSTDQQGFIAHAKKNGHVVHVIRSMQEFEKLFV
jgi:hypothetical protein